MKQLILIACLALCFSSASATHLISGAITYLSDTSATPNPRKYYFTMTLITNRESQADDPTVLIRMGDGNTITVPRRSVVANNNLTDTEIFKWEYTFATDGTYTIAWNGINRDGGILNIEAPSDQLSFYISSTVKVSSNNQSNRSPKFLRPDPLIAGAGQPLLYNLMTYDSDGDSLAYKLIAPRRQDGAGNILPVPGYTSPGNTFSCQNSDNTGEASFGLHIRDGQLIWDAPCRNGAYTTAIIIEEWRNGVKLGEVTYDTRILVVDLPEGEVALKEQQNLKLTKEGYVIAKINREVEIKFSFNNMFSNDGAIFSELAAVHKLPLDFKIEDSIDGKTGVLRFTADASLIRNRPYFITIYGRFPDNSYVTTTSFGIKIRTDQPIIELLKADEFARSENGHIVVTPVKPVKLNMFAEDFEGYVQTLSLESSLAAAAKKFTFTTRDSTDGKVGELLFQPSEAQLSEIPQTITFKATYNPARMAGERTSFAVEPIVKEMQVQVIVAQKLPTATPEELAAATYLIYPNPAQDKFTVQAENSATLSIYSLQGKLLLEQQLQPGTTEIRRPSTATSGLYFYSLTTQNGHKKTGKLVLQ